MTQEGTRIQRSIVKIEKVKKKKKKKKKEKEKEKEKSSPLAVLDPALLFDHCASASTPWTLEKLQRRKRKKEINWKKKKKKDQWN